MTEHIGSSFALASFVVSEVGIFYLGYIVIVTQAEVKAGSLGGTQVRDLSRPVSILRKGGKGGQGGKGLPTAGQHL